MNAPEVTQIARILRRFLRNTRVRYVDMIRAVVPDAGARCGWREAALDPESAVHHEGVERVGANGLTVDWPDVVFAILTAP